MLYQERLRYLLQAAVNHIEAFEEDQFQKVLKGLGFDECDINEIQGYQYIKQKATYHGHTVYELTKMGSDFIGSKASSEDEDVDIWRNLLHEQGKYFYVNNTGTITGFDVYSTSESYVTDFNDKETCFKWLIGEIDSSGRPSER